MADPLLRQKQAQTPPKYKQLIKAPRSAGRGIETHHQGPSEEEEEEEGGKLYYPTTGKFA